MFEINENSAFKFGGLSVRDLRKECNSLRGLSRKLASSKSFNKNSFQSMAKQFDVSIEARAIRLEELDLVQYCFASKAVNFSSQVYMPPIKDKKYRFNCFKRVCG